MPFRMKLQGKQQEIAIICFNFIFSTMGFTIAGCLVKKNRFYHFLGVALVVWLIRSMLSILFGTSLILLFKIFCLILTTMFIGYWLSFIFIKFDRNI